MNLIKMIYKLNIEVKKISMFNTNKTLRAEEYNYLIYKGEINTVLFLENFIIFICQLSEYLKFLLIVLVFIRMIMIVVM